MQNRPNFATEMGVDTMCGQVRMVGLNPTSGDAYIFVGKSRKVMKILRWVRECRPYSGWETSPYLANSPITSLLPYK